MWSYFFCTTSDIAEHLQPFDDTINMFFNPTLTGRDSVTEVEKDLVALPAHLGGLGLGKPREASPHAFSSSLNRHTSGMHTIRHSKLRHFTGKVMTEVCHDECLELPLQPLQGERFNHATAITADGAGLSIRAQGFWDDRHQQAFFDVRVFKTQTRHQTSQLL